MLYACGHQEYPRKIHLSWVLKPIEQQRLESASVRTLPFSSGCPLSKRPPPHTAYSEHLTRWMAKKKEPKCAGVSVCPLRGVFFQDGDWLHFHPWTIEK